MSTTSSIKATRWGFTDKFDLKGNYTLPMSTIKFRFKVTEILSADSFGEVMRIQKKKVRLGTHGAIVFNSCASD